MEFQNLGLIAPILNAIKDFGHNTPTPIQKATIPAILSHKDIIGCAQTGTGKTAAFVLPILQMVSQQRKTKNKVSVLVITPTRELASQIGQNIVSYNKYLNLAHTTIFGGVPQKRQEVILQKGVEIIIATPGRLLDLIQQNIIDCSAVTHFVLDEADTLLDLGFLNDIKKIIRKLPVKRQNLLFSATLPDNIRKLADEILVQPEFIGVDPVSSSSNTVDQKVIYLAAESKPETLKDILEANQKEQTLIFTRTKFGANKLVRYLVNKGYTPECIHGNKSQNAREKSLLAFKSKTSNILIATDIAARGIDIALLPLVINYDLPQETETYIHRIGRTGRAGNSGVAISFCTDTERPQFNKIQNLIGFKVPTYNNNILSQ